MNDIELIDELVKRAEDYQKQQENLHKVIPMKKKEYTRPAILEFELSSCNMLCASIIISDKETNSAGRTSKKRNGWDNGFWDY